MSLLLRMYPGDAWAFFIGNVLVQVTAVILAARLLTRLGSRWNAAWRHSIYLVAILCVLASPVLPSMMREMGISLVTLRPSAPTVVPTESAPIPMTPMPESSLIETRGASKLATELATKPEQVAVLEANNPGKALSAGSGAAESRSAFSFVEMFRAIVAGALVIWLLGIGWLLARWCYGLHLIAVLRRAAQPIDSAALAELLRPVRQALGTERLPPIATSASLDRPVMIGLVHPLVILPDNVLWRLRGPELTDVLVHECAHAVCRHQVVGVLQRLAGMLFWPHPLVHVLNRELARAREEVCDNYVLRRSDAPRYARTLLELSQLLVGVSPKPMALGLFHCQWRLEDRVADLLDRRRKVMTGINRWTAAGVTAAFLLIALLIAGTRLVQAEPAADKGAPASEKITEKIIERTTERTTERAVSETTTEKTAAMVEHRAVNKLVKDFPEKTDLSTPESALAAFNRSMARNDIHTALFDLSWEKPDAQLAKQLEDAGIPTNLKALLLGTEIIEVLTYRDDFAVVIYKNNLTGESPYCGVLYGKINGAWKDFGLGLFLGGDSLREPRELSRSVEAITERFEKNKDDLWRQFVEIRNEVLNGRTRTYSAKDRVASAESAKSEKTTTEKKAASVERRVVNKLVKDFPEKTDLSTPESAFAAFSRSVARIDIPAIQELFWIKMDTNGVNRVEQLLKDDPSDRKNFSQLLLDTNIIEVLMYQDDLAGVIYERSPAGKHLYDVQPFGRIDGTWKAFFGVTIGEGELPVAQAAIDRFEKKKNDLWRGLVAIRNHEGKVDVSQAAPMPRLSAAQKEKMMKRLMGGGVGLGIDLDVPDLEPQVVQYAFFDEDPIPALTTQLKQVQLFYRRQLNKAANEKEKEQARNSQMSVSWDFGFRNITADKLRLLTDSDRGAPTVLPFPPGKKWIVTKTVYLDGKPICWCIPIDVKTGNEIVITLNENNAFDLRTVYDKAMQGPLSAHNAKNWQVAFDLDAPSISPQAVQYSIFDEDPVPAFVAQVKRMAGHAREQLEKAHSEADKEQVNAAQMEVAWDLGFKGISGDKIYLIKNTSNSSMTSNGNAGRKWFVTKIVHANGKPVCWCIPVEVKTGELIEVGFNEKNMFDLRAAYDNAMGETDAKAVVPGTTERVIGVRPQGNCSISGTVLAEATGEPIEGARMYLHYRATHGSIFVNTDSKGSFEIRDIPTGPFSLIVSHTPGYQDAPYDPGGKSGIFPQFSLQNGEQRSGIVLKAKLACRISGKIVGDNGKMPEDIGAYEVLAWLKNEGGGKYHTQHGRVNHTDGSYVIDGLGEQPVYVMATNWRAAKEGDAWPVIYYPSSFSRTDAKQVVFDKSSHVDDVNITLRKEGGIVIEGTVRDETGKPVPEAFVVVHRRDMLFDFDTAYTDTEGHYQIQGLGDGEFLAHVDAAHRGFVRTRTPIDLDKASKKTQCDFTLHRGVLISGKFVDEKGEDWQIGVSYGYAAQISKDRPTRSQFELNEGDFSLTDFQNKHRPENAEKSFPGAFLLGEGDYDCDQAIFPTTTTFIIQGMMPGHTIIGLSPNKEKQKVVKILYDGRDILTLGVDTKPGDEIRDVTIVVGTETATPAGADDKRTDDKKSE